MQVDFRRCDWEFIRPFRIAYRTRTHAQTVVVEIRDGELLARGEAAGVSYRQETVDTLLDQLSSVAGPIADGASRAELQVLLPPGGARNAVDCALWDLEAKRANCRVWELMGMRAVRPLLTAYTLGLDTPAQMAQAAAAAAQYSLLKLKLAGDDDLDRVRAVRAARPDTPIIVDANQAWRYDQLAELAPELANLGVTLIEQPLPAGKDEELAGYQGPIPLCADESAQTSADIDRLLGKYQYINIKLDKAGGLTEAVRIASAAKHRGMKLMVGCMGGSSLSIAPAFMIGQLCDVVDLDSPLLVKSDMPHRIRYDGSTMSIPDSQLWG
jgi:L-Ala-D/L-Glu epimerase